LGSNPNDVFVTSSHIKNNKLSKKFKILLISFIRVDIEICLAIRKIDIEKPEFELLIEKIFIVNS
jgi:hypothetical protein